jgi:hypothetical protein
VLLEEAAGDAGGERAAGGGAEVDGHAAPTVSS